MDINDNQQINSFVKGMNTDVSDSLMDSSQYRYAENIRLVTNTDSNSGEVRLIEGVGPFSIEFPWSETQIMAMTSIRDIIVVVTKDDNIYAYSLPGKHGWTHVYGPKTWTMDDEDIDTQDDLTKKQENEHFGDYLSIVTRWETENLIKMYIADGKHQLMYINLADEDISQNPETYIVGIDNIYSDIEKTIMPITASISEQSGIIPPARVQYTYRFYKTGGAASSIAPLSNILSLYKTVNSGYKPDDEHTSKAVSLIIPENTIAELDKLQIFRVLYQQIGQLPAVQLIYDDDIIQTFTDRGYDIETQTLENLLSYIKIQITPKIIESKNDYLFAGNVKYTQSDFEKYLRDNNVDDKVKAPSDGCDANGYNHQMDPENILQYDRRFWRDPYAVQEGNTTTYGGQGDYIRWEYTANNFLCRFDNTKYKINNSGKEGGVISTCLPSFRHGEVYRFGIVFYSKSGLKSSVKWIADIMIPEMNYTVGGIDSIPIGINISGISNDPREYKIRRVGITFEIKAPLFNDLKEQVVAVEIVRAERTSSDRVCVSQGIIGIPYRVWKRDISDETCYNYNTSKTVDGTTVSNCETQYLCHPGLFSVNYLFTYPDTPDDEANKYMGVTDRRYLIFASPEICYQKDDMKGIFNNRKDNLYICPVYRNVNKVSGNGSSFDSTTNRAIRIWQDEPRDSHAMSMMVYEINQNTQIQVTGSNKNINFYHDGYEGDGFAFNSAAFAKSRVHYLKHDFNNELYRGTSTFQCFPYIQKFNNTPGVQTEDIPNYYKPISISDFAFPEQEEPGNLFTGEDDKVCMADKAMTPFASNTFMHWTNPMLINNSKVFDYMATPDPNPDNIMYKTCVGYPTGSVGRCAVLKLGEDENGVQQTFEYEDIAYTPQQSYLKYITFYTANIKSKIQPYGGISTINSTSYLSFGHTKYREKSTSPFLDYNSVFITTFDGDCFPGVFNYCAAHVWYEPVIPGGVKLGAFYSVPIESDIDLSATYGCLYTSDNSQHSYYLQDKKGVISNVFTQSEDMYSYNTAYGSSPNAIQHFALEETQYDTGEYDTRIHHSDVKTNGETIDNWLVFRSNNFLDVDTRFGELTNMRLFKDRLLYWQKNATGILSVNERSIVNDIDHNQIILGTGDILSRYDYISTVYGMKPNQYEAEIQSNTTQYWWDGTSKEILAYAGGTELVPLAKIKNCSNYINSHFENAHPSLSYDNQFNEVISSVVTKGSIVYNENVQQFTSIYTFNPVFRAIANQKLYLSSNDVIYAWNKTPNPSDQESKLFDNLGYTNALPKLQYVVNKGNSYNKVFDIVTFGGRFYGGDDSDINNLTFQFDTPLKQHSSCTGSNFITNREYDFRLAIPRNNNDSYGGRMRGKTMQCELSSSSNSIDFSLQYIITKYRMSWS